MKCRHCNHELAHTFLDLGSSPPSNAYLTAETLNKPEKWFPLKVMVCDHCWLVQTEDFADAHELFDADYAYFSSFSSSWLRHAEHYVEAMVDRFQLNASSRVIEIAANDGYLLQYIKAKNIPCLGIEPTHSTAMAAKEKGIEIIESFFGIALAEELAAKGYQADLTAANNVLAHVPDINDFVSGFARLLKPNGVSTFEFPHLVNLVQQNQFDTIYHEHFSYLSLTSVKAIFEKNGLQVFDVEELPTHGGSLRVYAQRIDSGIHPKTSRLQDLLNKEHALGVDSTHFYDDFQEKVDSIKDELIRFLTDLKRAGKKVIAYGAAAKGNTLLNFAGVRPDLLPYVVDKNPAKQNKFMPGSRIPIVDETIIHSEKPDYILILPWNLKHEVTSQLSYTDKWSANFVTAIPAIETF